MLHRKFHGQKKLIKNRCEICGFNNPAALNVHHIIPRCDSRCTNDNHNLSIVCHICHDLIHVGEIIVIGVYSSTQGRKLMWFRKGEQPPLEKIDWKVQDNPLILRSVNNKKL